MRSKRRIRSDVQNYQLPRVMPHIFISNSRYFMQNGQLCCVGRTLEECRTRFFALSDPDSNKVLKYIRNAPCDIQQLSLHVEQLMVELVKKDPHLLAFIEAQTKM